MGKDHLLEAGQIEKAVMEGLDGRFLDGLVGIGPSQVEKPPQGSHGPAGRSLLEPCHEGVEPLVLPDESLLLAAGTLVGPHPVKGLMMAG